MTVPQPQEQKPVSCVFRMKCLIQQGPDAVNRWIRKGLSSSQAAALPEMGGRGFLHQSGIH